MTDTEKINLRKALRNLILAVAIIAAISLLSGCGNLDIKQDFDFEVTNLPVPSQVGDGETLEIRFEIRHIEGRYDSNRYYVRYFPTSGAGFLIYDDSIMRPNDRYRIRSDEFRMRYTARSDGEHALSLTFSDDFGHAHELGLTFNKKEADTTPALPQTTNY